MSWASRCTERCHEAEGALRDVMGLEMSLREGARLTRVCATHTALYSGAQPSACACSITHGVTKEGTGASAGAGDGNTGSNTGIGLERKWARRQAYAKCVLRCVELCRQRCLDANYAKC